jgi:hypothetical protein
MRKSFAERALGYRSAMEKFPGAGGRIPAGGGYPANRLRPGRRIVGAAD